MNIYDWVQEEHNSLEEFAIYWAENHKTSPDSFPLEMDAGEWDEQYRAWQS